jgi:hypothetical protein
VSASLSTSWLQKLSRVPLLHCLGASFGVVERAPQEEAVEAGFLRQPAFAP